MVRKHLLEWQWSDYPAKHRNRVNLLLHIVAVPLFQIGTVILLYALLYSIIRFLIEFLRDDPRGDVFGLTTRTGLSTSQLISIVVGIGALILLIVRWRAASASTKPAVKPRTAEI